MDLVLTTKSVVLRVAEPAVQAHTQGRTVRKVIVARGKLVNVVIA